MALVVKNLPAHTDVRNMGLIPGSERSSGGGHGNPLQSSCLENSMDGGAWLANVHRITELDMTEVTEHSQYERFLSRHFKMIVMTVKCIHCALI